MAILEMKRVELLAMQSDRKAILETIQRDGHIDISGVEEVEGLTSMDTASSVLTFEKWQDTAEQALELLNKYAPTKEGGGLLSSFAPRPDLSVTEFYEKVSGTKETIAKCQDIIALSKEVQDSKVEALQAQTKMDLLKPWLNLDIAETFKGTATTACFIGSFSLPITRDEILARIAQQYPELDCEIEIVSSSKNMTCLVALCHKQNEKALEQALRNLGFIALSDPSKETPAERMEELQKKVEDANAKATAAQEQLAACGTARADIRFLVDYLVLREDKYRALNKLLMNDRVFILCGYIPAKYAEKTLEKLDRKFDIAYSLEEADTETEDVPVALENGKLGSTLENITNMYAVPSQNDLDPNLAMTVFYYSLFGLMLGDAGYGLLMVIACLIVKFKFRMEPQKARTVNYGLGCGIGTAVWGALMNGWFGDLPHYIVNGLKDGDKLDFITANHLYWFSPIDNTTRFLLLCFFVGILHLGWGVIVNMIKEIKFNSVFESLVNNVPQLLILVGVIPLINSQIGNGALAEIPSTRWVENLIQSLSTPLYICLAAGAALVVLGPGLIAIKDRKPFGKVLGAIGGGLYGLYNAASGYLGDILSYARLLALGLCTGVIANVVNQLAGMLGNPVLFVLVALVGHAINFGINLIGAYVHTNRLQYVEFFSKFYEGGGTLYNPLSARSKTFKFKEETQS